MAARTVDTQHARTVSPKQNSSASDAHIAPKQMNTLHVMSYGPDWPFTPSRREKKLAASSRQRSHRLAIPQPDTFTLAAPCECSLMNK
jgi:hypothetical protein